jgi:CDP-diacylglycerol--serine O-phosphatidyltransferase
MIHKIKQGIPNVLTCLNLLSGCMGCLAAIHGAFYATFTCVMLSAFFDFFDGLTARALKVSSPIGKELDSLADDISFGLVPALIVYTLMKEMLMDDITHLSWPPFIQGIIPILPFLAFLIAIFSALRLAKFNIDPRQAHSFIGLPTPANTLFWVSFAMGYHSLFSAFNIFALIVMILLSSWLLVAEIPMFSLKFENLRWSDNKVRFIFLITIIPLFLLGKICLAAIILWYIILSIVTCKKQTH